MVENIRKGSMSPGQVALTFVKPLNRRRYDQVRLSRSTGSAGINRFVQTDPLHGGKPEKILMKKSIIAYPPWQKTYAHQQYCQNTSYDRDFPIHPLRRNQNTPEQQREQAQ
jgi:hypothetical protein